MHFLAKQLKNYSTSKLVPPSGKSWIRHFKDLLAAGGALKGSASTTLGEGRKGNRLRGPGPGFSKQRHRTGLYWGAARKQVPLIMYEHIAYT